MAHSPAPWKATIDPKGRDGPFCDGIEDAGGNHVIFSPEPYEIRNLDDAALIEAAPLLLASCKEALDQWPESPSSDLRDRMEAAVAAAQGGPGSPHQGESRYI